MKKSLSRALIVVLTVAIMITLLPATFVSAANAPVFTLSIVNSEGAAVEALHPGTSAYLRVSVSGIEQLYNMAIEVSATNALFDTDVNGLVKRYESVPALRAAREISLTNGVALSATTASIKFTKILDASIPDITIPVSEFVFVDIPFTVPAETAVGTNVAFAFSTDTNDTNFYVASGAPNRYTIGHATRFITPVNKAITVTEVPYAITSVALKTAIDEIPLGTDFPGFAADNKIVATYDRDRDGDQVMDTAEYEIVTDAPAEGKAYIDISTFNKDARGTYTFDVVVVDSTLAPEGRTYTQEDAVSVTVGDPVPTGTITTNTTKVVEVKYGADAAAVKAAISARTDLFKDIYTDGTQVDAVYTVDVANIDTTGYVSTSVGTEQTVTVTAVAGKTVADGSVKVKVTPTTITSIELEPGWEPYPAAPNGTAFQGFGERTIIATFDSETSAIESAIFDIVTDAAASEKAYVDVTTYDASAAGEYTLPVMITTAAIAVPYEGSISLTVDPAESTGTITADTTKVVEVKYGADAAAVKAAISARTDLFRDIYTDGSQVDAAYTVDVANIDTTGYVSTAADTEQTVTVTAVAGKTVADGSVKVKVTPATITSIGLDPEWESYPAAPGGTSFQGFGERTIIATFDPATSAIESAIFDIVTDGAVSEKAYVDVTMYDASTAGEYTLPVVIKSSALGNSQYEGTITLTVDPAGSTGTITADTTKVVEVKYGADAAAVKAAISARTDLFRDIYTDGSQVDAAYTVDVANIDTTGYVSTAADTEQTVTVTAVAGKTVADGSVKVKVNPTTITGIALDSAWVNHPEMPNGTQFPGFGGRSIVATFDPETSAIENATFDIVTDGAASEKAYVDVTTYDAAAAGEYTLPVVITTAAIAVPYEGSIILTVDSAALTDNVRLINDSLALDNPAGGDSDIAAAESLVMSTEGLFATVLTNDETAAVAEGVFATSVTSQYSAAEKIIYVTITSVSGGKTLVGENIVAVSVNTAPVIKGSVRVSDTTEEVIGFTNAVPTGAVITAVKLTSDGNGGNFVAPDYVSYATDTDIYGNFELEVEPGIYKVYVAHAKYEFFEGELYISTTIKEEYDITVEDGDEENLGLIDLNYTFFGDTDTDGDVDDEDFANFAPKFGTSVN